jgi:hypothetical protein
MEERRWKKKQMGEGHNLNTKTDEHRTSNVEFGNVAQPPSAVSLSG